MLCVCVCVCTCAFWLTDRLNVNVSTIFLYGASLNMLRQGLSLNVNLLFDLGDGPGNFSDPLLSHSASLVLQVHGTTPSLSIGAGYLCILLTEHIPSPTLSFIKP